MPILNWRELQNLVNQKQKGYDIGATGEQTLSGIGSVDPTQAEDAYNKFVTPSKSQQYQNVAEGQEWYRRGIESVGELGNEVDDGYGESKYDLNVPYEDWVKDPMNYRANGQSGWKKFWNGAAKLVPYALTTFLDNTAGLVGAITNVAIDADIPLLSKEGSRSFIDTPFAEAMQSVRDWSEKVFPNFRTTEEVENQDKWWQYLNANFWGDTFLKNLGFTIGAATSGGVYSKAFRALQPKIVNKAYKAAVAASVEGDVAAEEAFRKVLQGGAMQNPKKIYDTFANVRKSYQRLSVESQLLGGIGGAIGESRVEAMTAAREFRDEYLANAQARYEQSKQKLGEEISSNPLYFGTEPIYDGFGNIIGTKPALNSDGTKAYQEGLASIQKTYNDEIKAVEEQASNLVNTTFWLNMPLLTASQIIQFGRLFSGGFNTQAKIKVGGKFGEYTGKGTLAGAIGKGVRNSVTEGMEELSQKVFSEGSKDIAKHNMAAFYNDKYDKESIKDVSEWLMSMSETAGNVLTDSTSWEEFAVGALTGALGLPGGFNFKNWRGGIIGGIQEGLADMKASQEAADALNAAIAKLEFKTPWEGLVRHNKYENIKDAALADNDSFLWHSVNDAQMLSDIMLFARAGKLNDLEDYIDSFVNISLDQIPALRASFSDETDLKFKNKSDEQLLEWLHKRAFEMKRTLNQYRNFHDSIDFLSLGTTDPDTIDELVYTQAQLQNFEDRYNSILRDVIGKVRPTIERIARETNSDGSPTQRAEQAQELLSKEENLTRLFGGYAMDIKARSQDANPGTGGWVATMMDDARQEQVLDELEKWGAFTDDSSVKKQVSDLQKLVRSYQNLYAKLFDPNFRQSFEESRKQADDVIEDLQNDARKKKVDDYMTKLAVANNLKEYLNIFDNLEEIDDPEILSMLQQRISEDPKLNSYEKVANAGFGFMNELQKAVSDKQASLKDPTKIYDLEAVAEAVNDLDVNAVLVDMPEGSIPSVAIGAALLDALKTNPNAENIVRTILEEKLGDIAQANGLGVAPSSPGTGSDSGGGEGGVTQFQHLSELLDKTMDINDTTLQKILAGDFSDFSDLTDEEKIQLIAKAAAQNEALMKKFGLIADKDPEAPVEEDDNPNDPNRVRAHKEFVGIDTNSVSGSRLSIYHPGELMKGRVKRFTSKTPGVNATLDWLDKHHVQQFIDSGALAKLNAEYEKKGKKLPIYFIGNPHYIEGNQENNPFVVPYPGHPKYHNVAPNVLLAVEMNDDNRQILKDFENAGVFSGNTMITAQDGAQYQVIGIVWNSTPKEISSKPAEEQEAYKNVKTEANRIWDYAIGKSILPQYIADVEAVGEAAFPKEGLWYVAKDHPTVDTQETDTHKSDWSTGERIYTTLNYIMSGRNETRAVGSNEYKKIPLSQSLQEYEKLGKEYYFALPVAEGILYTTGSPPIPSSINAPVGSLWMATQEANGSWAWTAITIARTDEFNWKDNADTHIMQRFNAAINDIFSPTNPTASKKEHVEDFNKRVAACRLLSNMFYLGNGNTITFSFIPGEGISTVSGDQTYHIELNVGGVSCLNRDEVIGALKTGKYRFQVSSNTLSNSEEMGHLIDAGVLRSEMRSFIRKGASVGVNFLEDVDSKGNPVAVHPKDSLLSVTRTSGIERASISGAIEGSISNIRIGESGYRLNPDGTVNRMSAGRRVGERVNDPIVVAQVKAIGELLALGKENALESYNGQRWTVDRKGQYSELFEKEIDGITVRMQRLGHNGAFQLVYSDQLWDAIMTVAQPVGIRFTPTEVPVAPEAQQAEDVAAYNKAMAEAEGGTVTPPKKKTNKGAERFNKQGKTKQKQTTVQDKEINDGKTEETVDCG